MKKTRKKSFKSPSTESTIFRDLPSFLDDLLFVCFACCTQTTAQSSSCNVTNHFLQLVHSAVYITSSVSIFLGNQNWSPKTQSYECLHLRPKSFSMKKSITYLFDEDDENGLHDVNRRLEDNGQCKQEIVGFVETSHPLFNHSFCLF